MTTRTPTTIKIYWDERDPNLHGWSYEALDDEGVIDSGGLDGDLSLDDAIDEACSELDVDLRCDQFARDKVTHGGYALWYADRNED